MGDDDDGSYRKQAERERETGEPNAEDHVQALRGSRYAIQKIDEGRGIIHNLQYLKDFTRVLNESGVPYLEITYDNEMNGSIGVKNDAGRGRAAALSR